MHCRHMSNQYEIRLTLFSMTIPFPPERPPAARMAYLQSMSMSIAHVLRYPTKLIITAPSKIPD